jgi:hypothetical protein
VARTLPENFYVSREWYYLSEYPFEIGKNYFPPPLPIGEKNRWKTRFLLKMLNK